MSPATLSQTAPTATAAARQARRHRATVAADLTALLDVRDALASALCECGWSDEDSFRVLIGADEAFANALSHGSGEAATVRIAFRVTSATTTVVVADANRDGVPAPAVPVIPPESSEHGRGLILMRALADRMLVRGGAGGTTVALAFESSLTPPGVPRRRSD